MQMTTKRYAAADHADVSPGSHFGPFRCVDDTYNHVTWHAAYSRGSISLGSRDVHFWDLTFRPLVVTRPRRPVSSTSSTGFPISVL